MMIAAILKEVVFPIFLLIGIGVWLQRAFKLDLYTLAKLNIYYTLPATIFIKLYEADFTGELLKLVLLFFLLSFATLYTISSLSARVLGLREGTKAAFINSALLDNSGNYAVPLNQLAFRNDPLAMSVQVLILSIQSFLTFSYGVIVLQKAEGHKLRGMLAYFRMPVFYALAAGLTLNLAQVPIPGFLLKPVKYISDGLIAAALLTLGAQIAFIRLGFRRPDVYASLLVRLLGGPLIGFAVIELLGVEGILAQALLISSGMPTSVNSAILAQEYNNEPEFASQTVLLSTLLNGLTITAVIHIAQFLYSPS